MDRSPASAETREHSDTGSEDGTRAEAEEEDDDDVVGFWPGLGRAAAGALIFEVPSLLTQEMWTLAHVAKPWRLALVCALLCVLILRLSAASGFNPSTRFADDVADAGAAVAVAAVIAAVFLVCFGIVNLDTPSAGIAAMIVAQTIPGSIGAALARAQFGPKDVERDAKDRHGEWAGELFFMIVGALVFMVPVAATDEIVKLAWKMGPIQLGALALITLAMMHSIVYALKLRDGDEDAERGFWTLFSLYTVTGYAAIALVGAYLLWTFGRLDGAEPQAAIGPVVVLCLPGGLGAAVARLVL